MTFGPQLQSRLSGVSLSCALVEPDCVPSAIRKLVTETGFDKLIVFDISYHIISYRKFVVPPLHYKTMGALHSSWLKS